MRHTFQNCLLFSALSLASAHAEPSRTPFEDLPPPTLEAVEVDGRETLRYIVPRNPETIGWRMVVDTSIDLMQWSIAATLIDGVDPFGPGVESAATGHPPVAVIGPGKDAPEAGQRFYRTRIIEEPPADPLVAGSITDHSIQIGDDLRHYRIYAPEADMSGRPVWLLLHGGNQSYTIIDDQSISGQATRALADGNGVLLVIPNGTNKDTGAFDSTENARWNDDRITEGAGANGPIVDGVDGEDGIDDVSFLTALLQYIHHNYKTNRSRTFVSGVSNGGYMTQKMLIHRPALFAAGASLLASVSEPMLANPPAQPVPILFWHGTEDPIVLFEGVPGNIKSAAFSAQWWAEANGGGPPDPPVSISDPDADGCYTTLTVYPGVAPVHHYISHGGGHIVSSQSNHLSQYPFLYAQLQSVFGNQCADVDAIDRVWDFFSAY